jgi:DNA ligase-1
MLEKIKAFVEQSNSSNSNLDKLKVLEQFKDDLEVTRMLKYVYSPFKQYYVTSKNLKKRSDLMNSHTDNDLFNLLDRLNNREITGHAALAEVNGFISNNEEYADLIYNIIDRNLKTRSTTSMINKIIPGCVPTFDVALASAYDDKTKKKVNFIEDDWYLSRKLDGVRCLAIFNEWGEVSLYSRSGKPFLTLENVKKELQSLDLQNVVMDGEICMVDDDGNEDFQSIIKEIKRKNHTIEKPLFQAFDLITAEDFANKVSKEPLYLRLQTLEMILGNPNLEYIKYLQQYLTTGEDMVKEQMAIAAKEGWEGLMLRKDDVYKGKRSQDILKVKKMFDAEYIVVGLENAINRVIVDGKEVDEMMLKNVVIEHKGNRVQVGSGFSLEQKRNFFENPNKILNKTITVQYFEETTNQEGEHSLRFPVIKAIYEEARDF